FLLDREVHDRRQAELALRDEQSRTQKLLLNVLPQAIVDRLARNDRLDMDNEVLADRFEEATILFADIVDFTPLSVQLPPLELVKLLNRIFSAFDRLAEDFGLEKIKTIGDAYMVVGGIPVPRPDHAIAIMEMAIAMRREINQLRRETGLPLALRIGINTGAVVAGVIGIKKFSYDLWGDTVNVASRMESQGIPGKIQVTEATYEYLKDHYEFERWSNLAVKGRGRMTAYLYVRRRSTSATPEADGPDSPSAEPIEPAEPTHPVERSRRHPTPEVAI
ncbi:MAG TPA: adenylate/guanylate cyclase domain-containing protein, partial [Coleofasciculaceae cyanobacterium]